MHFTGSVLFIVFFNSSSVCAQPDTSLSIITEKQAIELALKNNLNLQAGSLQIESIQYKKWIAWNFDPTEISLKSGHLYGSEFGRYLEINQNFGSFLTHYKLQQRTLSEQNYLNIQLEIAKDEIISETRSAYAILQLLLAQQELWSHLSILYDQYQTILIKQYDLGEIDLLEKCTEDTKIAEFYLSYTSNFDDIAIAQLIFRKILHTEINYLPEKFEPQLYAIERTVDSSDIESGSKFALYQSALNLNNLEINIKKSEYFPEISMGYFNQSIGNQNNLWGWQVGITIPLDIPQQNAAIKKVKIESEIKTLHIDEQKNEIINNYEKQLYELNRNFRQVRFYEENALIKAELLKQTSQNKFDAEEIQFSEYLQGITTATHIYINYLTAVNAYNQKAFEIEMYLR